ncbi:MAG: hypothetical protein H7141_10770 [Burkholderiales bacterium]|nr:hypothetical protein [Bacteroidia bacterium]
MTNEFVKSHHQYTLMSLEQNILLLKLDEFIRKYYKNQLIRGLLYTLGLLVAAFLFLVVAEYFAEFGTTIRTVLFYAFLAMSGYVLFKYIAIPVLKLNRLGAIISYDEAANIIGQHFKNINDKLLNTLQLQRNSGSILSSELLTASINQKMHELKPIPFTSAINLNENKRYLKFALPPVVLMLLILAVKPDLIKDSTERIVFHQTYFEKKAPFQFTIHNKSLEAIQQQDYVLELKLNGNEIPNEVFITVGGIDHKMEKIDNINYTYTFKNVQKNQDFIFTAAGFNSKTYELAVLPKPMLMKFDIRLTYPSYLNKKNETVSNIGDMQLPQGTKMQWVFHTKNTDNIFLNFADTLADISRSSENEFSFTKRMMQSMGYSIKTMNGFLKQNPDSVNYMLNVNPDQSPIIDVSEKTDSINPKNIYFSGTIKDDYGFSRLQFKYTHYTQDSTGKALVKSGEQVMGVNKQQITQPYYYFLDASRFNVLPGDKIEYYFEVWDNDGVNGSKSAKTKTMLFKAPTIDEVNQSTDKNNSEIKKDLDDGIKKAKDLQKDINDLGKKLTEKKQMGYEEKKKLEDILKKQNELKNKIEETKQENQLNNQQQQEFTPPDESLLEKQKQLEQLFENIMTPEMKKLFDELNKLMDKLDKNQVQQKLEELKLSNKDMEKELDRTLEAFKQMEVEQKMQQAIDKLDELKNKQDELKKETEGNKAKEETKEKEGNKGKEETKEASNKELEKKQDDLNKQFEDLKKDLKEMREKNAALEQPNELPKTEEKQNEISKEMEKSSEELNQNSKKNASKSQKQASDKMQEMKEQMQKAMDKMEKEEQEEDMQTLRQILENLLNLSFAQEDLMGQLAKLRVDNPQYLKITQTQKKLQDDSKIIEDSLLALSKRVPAISAVVNREISSINMNMGKAVSELAERMQSNAQMRMQYSMTSINNLALMLNENLENMQKQAKESKEGKPGSGSCKKPGKGQKPSSKPGDGKPSMANMKQMQQQLNKQLEQLKKALEQQGNKPGGQKPGNKSGEKPGGQKPGGQGGMGQQGQQGMMPGVQGQGMSEQLAKMAAQQEALRRQMQQMMDKIKKDGGSNPGGNIAELMEQTEKDIVNRQITQETMKRQQDIITKLLESEKAEREREQDEKRKSNEAKNEILSNPTQFLEYKRLREKELELLNTVSPSLTPYYKQKVNEYFNSVK